MKRRDFLRSGLLAAAAASTSTVPAAPSARAPRSSTQGPKKRPNILVISTDQQFAEAMSCAGNPHLRTPAIDRIAREGMRFNRAYCTNPICVPSRASYMTGLYPHENKVTFNVNQHELVGACGASAFRDAGYDTGHVGKWHIPRAIQDQEWSGFNYIAAARNNRVDFDIPDQAVSFIQQKRDQPFLLFASFVNPHDICQWARIASNIKDDLPNGPIPSPPPPSECPELPANFEIPAFEPSVVREHQHQPGNTGTYPTRDWGGREDGRWRQYLWAYYRMTEMVDAYIGQVLDALRETGQEEDTAIVFFSDHGDGIASHRWNQKTLFYEESARIPFIVSWKGQTVPGSLNHNRLVNLGPDLFPTLFDLANIRCPEPMKGASVKSTAFGDPAAKGPSHIVCQNNLHPAYGQPGVHGRMVRTHRYKYIRYESGQDPEQLFDLDLDPGEMNSLAYSSSHQIILEEHRALLHRFIKEKGDFFPVLA
jgi:arylsulfatase A-like enzyme